MLIDILEPMRAQFDRLRCEVCQNLFLSPMNTGFLRHAVATVLTVYGIETIGETEVNKEEGVATVLTVYGIETKKILASYLLNLSLLQQCLPFTVLKHTKHCILTHILSQLQQCLPFTVLKRFINCDNTHNNSHCNSTYRLRY